MRSVADALRARTITQVLAMSPGERIALALSLGDDDLELFVKTSGLERRGARTPARDAGTEGRQAAPRRALVGRRPTHRAAPDLMLLKLYAGGTQDLWDIRELLRLPDGELWRAPVETELVTLPQFMQDRWSSVRQ